MKKLDIFKGYPHLYYKKVIDIVSLGGDGFQYKSLVYFIRKNDPSLSDTNIISSGFWDRDYNASAHIMAEDKVLSEKVAV
jgi:hypothetical protein